MLVPTGLLVCSTFVLSQVRLDLDTLEYHAPSFTGIHSLGAVTTPPLLPIQVTLDRIWPLSVLGTGKLELDLTLRNTGKEPISIPASRRYDLTENVGNAGIRHMAVGVRLTPIDKSPKLDPLDLILGVASTSTNVPESMLLLEPNATLAIHASGNLYEAGNSWRDLAPFMNVRAQAVYRETYFDADLFQTSSSVPAVSANSQDFTITWRH